MSRALRAIERLTWFRPAVLDLAMAVSLAARVEPELLRIARLRLLPHHDAGIEADLWFSPLVESRNPVAMVFTPDAAEELRRRLLDGKDATFSLDDAWALVKEAHADAPPTIKLIEELTWLALKDVPRTEIEEKLRPLVVAAFRGEQKEYIDWAHRIHDRLQPQIRATAAFGMLLWGRPEAPATRVLQAPTGELKAWIWSQLARTSERTTLFLAVEPSAIVLGVEPERADYAISVPDTDPQVLDLRGSNEPTFEWRPVVVHKAASYRFTVDGFPAEIRTLSGDVYSIPEMRSLADLPEVIGFFAYSREDDADFEGTLSALRNAIQRELSAQLGRSQTTFRLWQDKEAIAPGQLWESEIKTAVEQAVFFIPIVTPRAVNSDYCKWEFEAFLAREHALGRNDLIFPLLYLRVPALENETQWRKDPVLSIIGSRQYLDWRPFRHLDVRTTAVREAIERFCDQIVEALRTPWVSPEEIEALRRAKPARRAQEEEQRTKVPEMGVRSALAMTAFVGMVTLAFHVGTFRPEGPDRSEAEDALRNSLGWSGDAFRRVWVDSEGFIESLLRERFAPDWQQMWKRLAAMMPGLKVLPFDQLLPWSLEALANVHDALQASNTLDYSAYFDAGLFTEAQRLRPDLAGRFDEVQPSRYPSGNSLRAKADFRLLADLYRAAAAIVSGGEEAATLGRAISEGKEPPRSSATAFVTLAESYRPGYSQNVGTRWPEKVAVPGGLLATVDDVQAFVRQFSAIELLDPSWVAARRTWSAVKLCDEHEDQDGFLRIVLSTLQQVLDRSLDSFGNIAVDIGFRISASNWRIVRQATGSRLSATPWLGTRVEEDEPEVLLSGELQEVRDTFGHVREHLIRYLATERPHILP